MKTVEKIKEYSWAIMLMLMLLLFFRQCGVNRDIDKMQKDIKSSKEYSDSTHKAIKEIHTISEDVVRREMKNVMFQYLIYEDDLDKGKISLSDIKNKIEEDEK